jgi:hypothetical protein
MHRSKQHHYSITSSARARTAAPGRWLIGRPQGALRTYLNKRNGGLPHGPSPSGTCPRLRVPW